MRPAISTFMFVSALAGSGAFLMPVTRQGQTGLRLYAEPPQKINVKIDLESPKVSKPRYYTVPLRIIRGLASCV